MPVDLPIAQATLYAVTCWIAGTIRERSLTKRFVSISCPSRMPVKRRADTQPIEVLPCALWAW